jgi:hypothetical protein
LIEKGLVVPTPSKALDAFYDSAPSNDELAITRARIPDLTKVVEDIEFEATADSTALFSSKISEPQQAPSLYVAPQTPEATSGEEQAADSPPGQDPFPTLSPSDTATPPPSPKKAEKSEIENLLEPELSRAVDQADQRLAKPLSPKDKKVD